jgi:penicillin amidase
VKSPLSPLWQKAGGFEEIVNRALGRCIEVLTSEVDAEPSQWHWGVVHSISFDHLFVQEPSLADAFRTGPFSIGGDSNTVMQTDVPPEDPFSPPAVAPSYRQIIDLRHLEESLAIFAPGQSGHLGSPHYADMVDPWLNGEYFPMTAMRDGEETVSNLILAPPISTTEDGGAD